MKLTSYLQLMRFHKPVGILLLWFPTAWALWIANQGLPPLALLVYFFSGTVLMRAAGCVVNDIADRHIDINVKRTTMRPLTAGKISLFEALMVLMVLLLGALGIVMQLPTVCFYYALVALVVTLVYPFCKRFLQAPQMVLGVAFSMGISMAVSASAMLVTLPILLLLLINFLWIISYDTMYAMVDREDDLRIGVKSTAVLFANYDRVIIMLLQVTFHLLWLYLAFVLEYSIWFYSCWFVAAFILIYQQTLVNSRDEEACFKAFSVNFWYGALMWLAVILAYGY